MVDGAEVCERDSQTARQPQHSSQRGTKAARDGWLCVWCVDGRACCTENPGAVAPSLAWVVVDGPGRSCHFFLPYPSVPFYFHPSKAKKPALAAGRCWSLLVGLPLCAPSRSTTHRCAFTVIARRLLAQTAPRYTPANWA